MRSCVTAPAEARIKPLTIEREIAHDPVRQKADIGTAVSLLEKLRAEIG